MSRGILLAALGGILIGGGCAHHQFADTNYIEQAAAHGCDLEKVEVDGNRKSYRIICQESDG